MISYETILDQFSKFGAVNAVMRSPRPPLGYRGDPPWVEYELTIYPRPDETAALTDADYRRAAFEVSEQAIKFAEENYVMTSGPLYQARTYLGLDGKMDYIEARLELEFREKL